MTRRRTGSDGQALAEFALVIPIFLILVFGIIDLGRYVYTASALSNGAREGARSGSVGNRPSPDCDTLSRENCVIAITRSRSWGLPSTTITPTVVCERIAPGDPTPNPIAVSQCRTNDLLKVKAQSTFTLITPIIAQFVGNLSISGESRVTVNQ